MPGIGSVWHWVILLVVVLLVFGTKKLKNVGQDLGDAVKNFRSAMASADKADEPAEPQQIAESAPRRVVDPAPAAPGAKAGATAGSAPGSAPGDRRSDWPNS